MTFCYFLTDSVDLSIVNGYDKKSFQTNKKTFWVRKEKTALLAASPNKYVISQHSEIVLKEIHRF